MLKNIGGLSPPLINIKGASAPLAPLVPTPMIPSQLVSTGASPILTTKGIILV